MRKQISHGYLLGEGRIGEFERGIQLFYGCVPAHFAPTDNRRDHRGRDRLGEGGEFKDGVRVYPRRAAQFPNSVASKKNDLVLLNHGDGKARNLGGLHRFFYVRVEVC